MNSNFEIPGEILVMDYCGIQLRKKIPFTSRQNYKLFMIATKSAATNDAPPINPPSTSG